MEALYGDALHFSQRSTSTTLLPAHNKLRVLPQREPVVRSHKSPISPKYGYTNISLTLEKYHFSPPGNVTMGIALPYASQASYLSSDSLYVPPSHNLSHLQLVTLRGQSRHHLCSGCNHHQYPSIHRWLSFTTRECAQSHESVVGKCSHNQYLLSAIWSMLNLPIKLHFRIVSQTFHP